MPNQPLKQHTPSPKPPTIRQHLEWSWNYAIAEQLHDDTIRHNAQWVSAGIGRGEMQTDEDLLQDFVQNRIDEGKVMNEWRMEGPTDQRMLEELVAKYARRILGHKVVEG